MHPHEPVGAVDGVDPHRPRRPLQQRRHEHEPVLLTSVNEVSSCNSRSSSSRPPRGRSHGAPSRERSPSTGTASPPQRVDDPEFPKVTVTHHATDDAPKRFGKTPQPRTDAHPGGRPAVGRGCYGDRRTNVPRHSPDQPDDEPGVDNPLGHSRSPARPCGWNVPLSEPAELRRARRAPARGWRIRTRRGSPAADALRHHRRQPPRGVPEDSTPPQRLPTVSAARRQSSNTRGAGTSACLSLLLSPTFSVVRDWRSGPLRQCHAGVWEMRVAVAAAAPMTGRAISRSRSAATGRPPTSDVPSWRRTTR